MYKAPGNSRIGTFGRRRAKEAGIRAQVVAGAAPALSAPTITHAICRHTEREERET